MAVCDSEQYFIDKADEDIDRWVERYAVDYDRARLALKVNDKYIGPGYGKAGDEVFETIKWLAKTEGIVLDPVYTGKAFHGMLTEIEAGLCPPGSDVIFIHTGGVFGLFPFADRIDDTVQAFQS